MADRVAYLAGRMADLARAYRLPADFRSIGGGDGEGDDQESTKPPTNGDPPGQGTTPPNGEERRFTQADLDRAIDERLKREREKAERDRAKATQEAEERAAAEKGEFKTLAEQRQARITELETERKNVATERDDLKAKVERYETALTAQLTAARKDLPKHVTELLDRLDVADQLEYLAKHAGDLGGSSRAGTPPTPRANGQTTDPVNDYLRRAYQPRAVT